MNTPTSAPRRRVIGPMARVTARGLWSRRRRLAGLLAAVFLGVAFLTGTLGLSATMSDAITTSFTTAYQGTDAVVRNATTTAGGRQAVRGPIDASIVDTVRAVPGVAVARGQVQGTGAIAGADGRLITSRGPQNADTWITDATLNPWRLTSGTAPRGPDQVVIDQSSATRGNLHAGQRTTVYTPDPVPVTVSGIANYGSQHSNGGTTYVAFTLAGGQRHLLGGADEVTQVAVAAAPGTSQDQLVAAIEPVLPPGEQAVTGTAATGELIDAVGADFLNYFRAFLGIFAGIALLVAALSVHNTFGVVSAQRVSESALLRAIGATGRQVARAHLAEAAVLGLVGSAAGVAAGYGMTAALKGAFAGLGLDLPISGVVFTAGNAAVGVAVGVAVTLLAALTPALRAGRTAQVAALREAGVDTAGGSRTRTLTGAGLTAGAGGATAAAALAHGPVALVGLAGLATVAGVIVLGPVLATLTARVLGGPVARLRGLPGRLARRNAARAPRRTAATAAALTVGVAIVTLFMVFGASLKASTGANLDQTFTGDLVVSSAGVGYTGSGFSPQVATRIAARPGVGTAAGIANGSVLLDGDSTTVTIADPTALGRVFTVDAAPGQLAVSADAADTHGWHAGSAVPVTFADGRTVAMSVGTVYRPIMPLGDYVLPSSVWDSHAPARPDTAVFVALRPGADPAEVTGGVRDIARTYGGLTVRDRAGYLDEAASAVGTILNIVYVMLALAIVIALLGIGNTLGLAVHERTREIGLLRAVGASRRQVRTTLRWEAVLTAVLGTGTGAGLGLFLGWALVTAINAAEQVGVVAVPWPQVAVVLVAGGVAGVLAAARPARRAGRLGPLDAIATV